MPETSAESPPEWFTRALELHATEHSVTHEGCELRYRCWGVPDRPALLLVHGGAAHNHWWDFIAPLLTDRYYVVAPDLSGHGQSEWRAEYPRRLWAGELLAVVEALGLPSPPVVVGHSMGGLVTIVAAALHGERLAGAVIVDAPVRPHDPEAARARRGEVFRNPKTYPDRQRAIESFRLVPSQPCDNRFIVRHIAEHSLREVEGGVTWKFDPAVFTMTRREPMGDHLQGARCRLSLMVGEHSTVVTPAIAGHMAELLGGRAPLLTLPNAHHHLLLDQPLAFVEALRGQFSAWEFGAG